MRALLTTGTAFLLLFFISYSFGESLRKYFPEFKYSLPIGFYTVFGISQIVLYVPISIIMFNAIVLNIFILVLLFVAIILFIRNKLWIKLWKLRKSIIKTESLIIIGFFALALVTLGLFCKISADPSDSYFYISQIIENSYGRAINMSNPITGYIDYTINPAYRYQTYYLVIAGIFRVLNFSPYLFCIWCLPLFTALMNILTVQNLFEIKKMKSNLLFVIMPLLISYSSLRFGMNGSSFKVALFVYIYYLFEKLYEKKELKYEILLLLFMFAGISFHSSFLFQGVAILIVMAVLMIKKDDNSLDTIVMVSLPLLTYIPQYFENMKLLIPFLGLYCVYFIPSFLSKKIKAVYSKLVLVIIVLFALLVYGYGIADIFGKVTSIYSAIDFFQQGFWNVGSIYEILNSLFNTLLVLLSIIYLVKTKCKTWVSKVMILFIILFYNPISISFVSTYMTSEVYFRLRECLFQSVFIMSEVIFAVYSAKMIQYGMTLFNVTLLLLEYPVPNFYANSVMSFVYRLPDSLVEASLSVSEYCKSTETLNSRSRVLSTDPRAKLLFQHVYSIYTVQDLRNYQLNEYEFNWKDNTYAILSKSELMSEQMNLIQPGLEHYSLIPRLILMDQYQLPEVYEEVEKRCIVYFENKDYRVYECNYYFEN